VTRVIRFYWPILVLLIVITGFSIYLKTVPDTHCHFLFGQSVELLGLYQISYALPGLFLVFSFYTFVFGWYGLKQGRFPPEGFPVFARKTSYGLSAKVTSIAGLLFPVFAAYLLYLGIESMHSITKDRSHTEMNQVVVQQCSHNPP